MLQTGQLVRNVADRREMTLPDILFDSPFDSGIKLVRSHGTVQDLLSSFDPLFDLFTRKESCDSLNLTGLPVFIELAKREALVAHQIDLYCLSLTANSAQKQDASLFLLVANGNLIVLLAHCSACDSAEAISVVIYDNSYKAAK